MSTKRKTLTQRVAALEAEVRVLNSLRIDAITATLQKFLDGERARVTDEAIYGRLQKAIEEMGVDIYDRLTHQRVTVTIHTEEPHKASQ